MRNKPSMYLEVKNPRGPSKIDLSSSREGLNVGTAPAVESFVMSGSATSQSFVVVGKSEMVGAGSEIRSSSVGSSVGVGSLYMNRNTICLGRKPRKEVRLKLKVIL